MTTPKANKIFRLILNLERFRTCEKYHIIILGLRITILKCGPS